MPKREKKGGPKPYRRITREDVVTTASGALLSSDGSTVSAPTILIPLHQDVNASNASYFILTNSSGTDSIPSSVSATLSTINDFTPTIPYGLPNSHDGHPSASSSFSIPPPCPRPPIGDIRSTAPLIAPLWYNPYKPKALSGYFAHWFDISYPLGCDRKVECAGLVNKYVFRYILLLLKYLQVYTFFFLIST